jgi:hypothetical protein
VAPPLPETRLAGSAANSGLAVIVTAAAHRYLTQMGEVKRRNQPSMGEGSTTGSRRRFVCGDCGARCGGASAPSSRRQGAGGAPCFRFCGHANQNRISIVHELAGYLRTCECVVDVRDDWTLEFAVRPESLSAEHARIELDAYLRVWEAMNPTSSVGRLDGRLLASETPGAAGDEASRSHQVY